MKSNNDDGRNFLDVMHQTMMIRGVAFAFAVVFAVSIVLLARSFVGWLLFVAVEKQFRCNP